jgi:hypothetical protein
MERRNERKEKSFWKQKAAEKEREFHKQTCSMWF